MSEPPFLPFRYARRAPDIHGGDKHPFFSWFQVVNQASQTYEEVELDFIATDAMAKQLASGKNTKRHVAA